MEDTYPTNCIVLDRRPFRENDLRVVLFSDDKGRLDLIARGAKKITSKIAGHIEPFSQIKAMVVRGSHYSYLGSAISKNSFYNIKQDYLKCNLISEVNKILLKLVSGSESVDAKDIYFFQESYQLFISDRDGSELENYYYFYYYSYLFKLLSLLGYKPNLFRCADCDKKITEKDEKTFNFSKGGVSCCCKNDDQNKVLKIGNTEVKLLRFMIDNNFSDINDLKISKNLGKKVNYIINRYYLYLFE